MRRLLRFGTSRVLSRVHWRRPRRCFSTSAAPGQMAPSPSSVSPDSHSTVPPGDEPAATDPSQQEGEGEWHAEVSSEELWDAEVKQLTAFVERCKEVCDTPEAVEFARLYGQLRHEQNVESFEPATTLPGHDRSMYTAEEVQQLLSAVVAGNVVGNATQPRGHPSYLAAAPAVAVPPSAAPMAPSQVPVGASVHAPYAAMPPSQSASWHSAPVHSAGGPSVPSQTAVTAPLPPSATITTQSTAVPVPPAGAAVTVPPTDTAGTHTAAQEVPAIMQRRPVRLGLSLVARRHYDGLLWGVGQPDGGAAAAQPRASRSFKRTRPRNSATRPSQTSASSESSTATQTQESSGSGGGWFNRGVWRVLFG